MSISSYVVHSTKETGNIYLFALLNIQSIQNLFFPPEIDDHYQQQRSGYDKDIRDIVRYFEASCRVEGALPPKITPAAELDLFFGRGGASARYDIMLLLKLGRFI